MSVVAGFLSGLIGGLGLGGGGVLLIYLTALKNIEQPKAQGINLLFFLPVGLIAVIIYAVKKQIRFKEIWQIIAFGLIGAGGGSYLSSVIKPNMLGKFFGGFLILCAIKEIIYVIRLKRNKKCDILKKE